MTALITLSHGSRHPGAEAGVRRLTRAAGELLDVATVAAHLDFTEPSLPDAARALATELGDADLGVNPSNDGNSIRIVVPQLTEERRKGYSKMAGGRAEDARAAAKQRRKTWHSRRTSGN